VPVAQRLSHLPVIVDPSHSGGRRDLVLPLSRAAIAVGADGVIVDVHPTRSPRSATARRRWSSPTCANWPPWPPTCPRWSAAP
jgi:3-deoxy-D-arabino-heptulosonate 7-phosphate (DAHP) synthase